MTIDHALLEPVPQARIPAHAVSFTDPNLIDWLGQATAAELDDLAFGVVGMALDGTVTHYNAAESRFAGLSPDQAIGHGMFTTVAPCTNNYLVAHRFAREQTLDAIINYVFTFRVAPAKVQLRLMKNSACSHMFMAVHRPG